VIAMTLDEIARVVGGEVHGDGRLRVTGAAFVDSRSPVPEGLFVAVVGERVDGHDYADGAHAVLGSRPTGAASVVVADPVVALGQLARHVLDRLEAKVLALTGSQGKTGTKDYLAHVLSRAGVTVATAGNLNNELGVPLTVLRAGPDAAYLVVEMGARGTGHISYLCQIAPPDVAAVLNVGTAHIGEFGSREAIAAAKAEIVTALRPGGTAVLNADDDLTGAIPAPAGATTLTFGRLGQVTWGDVELDDLGRPTFTLEYAGSRHRISLTQTGAHQVSNAAAAAAMAVAAGVELDVIAHSLASATAASRWRMELHERADGLVLLNDSYNANPASMLAAIEALVAIGSRGGGRRTIAVLGEMLELGDESTAAHREVGAAAAEAGVDVLVTVGETAREIAAGWAGEAMVTAGREEAVTWLRDNTGAGDVVLIKASRGAALDVIADRLLVDQEGEPAQT